MAITDTLALRLAGRILPAGDRRVLVAFAEQAAVALQRHRLAAQAADTDRLAAANRMRTALLAAVSHDLRTPLAGIKAASSALRSHDLDLTEADRAELVATIDESADRLTALVDNLLDMSRLQAGAVTPTLGATDVPTAVHRALSWVEEPDRERIGLDWPEELPPALADSGLLSSACWPTSSATPSATRRPVRSPSPPGRWTSTSRCASSTTVPEWLRAIVSGCSHRSSGSGTRPPARGSAWGWRWPAA